MLCYMMMKGLSIAPNKRGYQPTHVWIGLKNVLFYRLKRKSEKGTNRGVRTYEKGVYIPPLLWGAENNILTTLVFRE